MHNGKKCSVLLLIAFIIAIGMVRFFPAAGEFYARHIYPGITTVLSAFSSVFPFSVGDLFILSASLFLLIYFLRILIRKKSRKERIFNLLLILGWIYVWFYLAWGLNYFRENFYARTGITPVSYTEEEFRHFLTDYVEKLNNSYTVTHSPDSLPVADEIQKGYARLEKEFGLIHPPAHLKAKTMLISPLLSKVGVTGYMGPFFCEFNLNRELRPEEYPGVFAHETAHRLGISSEAEANFYAWLICNRSESAAIRYSGNFILLGYVLQNANRLLSEDEFKQFTTSIRPEIIGQYKAYLKYWRNKYSPGIGKIQNYIYNLFLKSNQIASGTKNYSEEIGIIISWEKASGHAAN